MATTLPMSPRLESTAMVITMAMRKAAPIQKAMSMQTGSNMTTDNRYVRPTRS